MNTIRQSALKPVLAAALLGLLAQAVHAWQPGASELDTAIKAGDFAGYRSNASTWLQQQAPVTPDAAAMAKPVSYTHLTLPTIYSV